MQKNRRNFIGNAALGLFGLMPLSRTLSSEKTLINHAGVQQLGDENDLHPYFPSQDLAIVKEVVGVAHSNLDRLKELVDERPELAKATYDWGFGDVESALGAASHMGRKDIAEYLIDKGARPNIFTFAMLGKLNAVKNMIEDMPGIQRVKGPHGFTLLFHAQMRLRVKNVEGEEKEAQEALVAYLKSLPDANIRDTSLDITKEEQKVYMGKYTFGDGDDEYFDVSLNRREMLYLSRGEYIGRVLNRVGEHSFAPGGAPSVRIKFDVSDGVAQSITVHDPTPLVKALRVQG